MTRQLLGCEIDIIYMTSDEVDTSVAAGEVYDMYFSGSWYNNFDVNAAKGVFADISAEIQEVTPELYGIMPDSVWNLVKTKDGKLYGIPVKKDYAPMYFIAYDADVARDAGIEIPETINSLDDLTPYLVALKAAMAADPSLGDYPVVTNNVRALDAGFEYVNDASLIGVTVGGTQVQFLFDDETVLERYRVMRKWYQMGLVDPTEYPMEEYRRKHEIQFAQAWTGYDYTPSNGYNTNMTMYAGPYLNADGVKGGMVALHSALENDPERLALCLRFLELVNTNRTFRDILAYGVPDYHFNYRDVQDEDGNVVGQVVIRTEAGKDGYVPWRFSQGSYLINSIESSEQQLDGTFPPPDVNQWEKYFAQTDADTTPVSQLSGFVFDYENIVDLTQEINDLSAIRAEYLPILQSGTADTDATIQEMRGRMEAAGLDRVMTEAQRQLDEYLRNNNQVNMVN